MEVSVSWDPLPASEQVRLYRVYRQKGEGRWWLLAVVAHDAVDADGRVSVVDAPDYWPWPQGLDPALERCYTVSAVSEDGLEGPMSAAACAVPL